MSAPTDAPTPTAAAVGISEEDVRRAMRAYRTTRDGVAPPDDILDLFIETAGDHMRAVLAADRAALLAQREADAGRVFSAAEMRAVLNYECWDGGNTNRPRAHEVEIYNDVRRRLREIEDRAHRAALARAATEAP